MAQNAPGEPQGDVSASASSDMAETGDAGQTAPASATDELIERWFADHFHGSAVSRNAETYQVVFVAKEALKRLLKEQGK